MKNLSFLFVLIAILASTPVNAQTTAEEWLEAAEKAEAEGRWTDAGSARSNAAGLQGERGDYEKAAENFKKAAENFRKDGREAQADAEDIRSGSYYDSAAAKEEAAGNSQKAKELYKKAAEQYDKAKHTGAADAARQNADKVIEPYSPPPPLPVPSDVEGEYTVTAKGTGNTTGHIANLTITNKGNSPVNILEQTVYIPSDGQYQPYITVIPPTTVPPGTTTIPLDGYCVDVHTPPVPGGNPMPPVSTWVPVGDPDELIPPGTVSIIPTTPVPPFEPGDIPGIITSPNYKPITPDPEAGIIITWPGTDIPVGGTFIPGDDPSSFAPVIAKVFDEVTTATKVIQQQGTHPTPFTPDPPKEYPAVVQNVIWMVTSILSGDEYTEDDFAENLYQQFTTTTGTPIAKLPKEKKEELDEGIDQFWNTFTAVGVEAKVLKKVDDGMNDPNIVPISTVGSKVTRVDSLPRAERYKQDLKNCFFSKLEYSVVIFHDYTRGTGKSKKNSSDEHYPNEKNEATINLMKGDTLYVKLQDLSCECPCWTHIDPKTKIKHGSFCPCEITKVSLRTFETKAFSDLTEQEFEKYVLDSLRKEVGKNLDALKKAGGKQSDIDKLQKQLDDEKKLKKDNANRIEALKNSLRESWRSANSLNANSFIVKAGFKGTVEFIFDVKGKCTATDECKGSEFSREVKVTVKVP